MNDFVLWLLSDFALGLTYCLSRDMPKQNFKFDLCHIIVKLL